MSENSEDVGVSPVERKVPVTEHSGVRIFGEIDPKTLSKEEFYSSPDLLYHGSAKPFSFSSNYDYASSEHYTSNDGSQTLGVGFYTTAEKEIAENYSKVRQYSDSASPNITALLPYKARMLDIREKGNEYKNAPIPSELLEDWVDYFKSIYFDQERRKTLPWNVAGVEDIYFPYLVKLKKSGKPVDLRVLLGTSSNKEFKWMALPHPPHMKLFTDFMIQKGYDGLVAVEGGEGKYEKNHTSYVFFNLGKLGTYDSWHADSSKKLDRVESA